MSVVIPAQAATALAPAAGASRRRVKSIIPIFSLFIYDRPATSVPLEKELLVVAVDKSNVVVCNSARLRSETQRLKELCRCSMLFATTT